MQSNSRAADPENNRKEKKENEVRPRERVAETRKRFHRDAFGNEKLLGCCSPQLRRRETGTRRHVTSRRRLPPPSSVAEKPERSAAERAVSADSSTRDSHWTEGRRCGAQGFPARKRRPIYRSMAPLGCDAGTTWPRQPEKNPSTV
ncbi:UNVERIFIED_CONTAM: hypothetical protein HHA_293290 [Hammondia hammondi]|eukprot:XP_008884712.1 hypothetical protein HHA_293290 [Hammondia hammondi]